MFMLEEILKSSKKHARVIIVILLGIIAAGTVGGGLLIQNLNSILAEKGKVREATPGVSRRTVSHNFGQPKFGKQRSGISDR
jgi:hypothetical protein